MGPKVKISKFCFVIDHYWPNVVCCVVSCMNPIWASYLFSSTCTSDYHPSSAARFKSSKTVKVYKFPLFQNKLNPLILILTYCDSCQILLATRNAQSVALSKHTFIVSLSLYYALPPAIQFHLPNMTFSLNTCATVIVAGRVLLAACSAEGRSAWSTRQRGRAVERCFYLLDVSKLVIPFLMSTPVVGRECSQLSQPSQAKALTEGGVLLSVSHSCVLPHGWTL